LRLLSRPFGALDLLNVPPSFFSLFFLLGLFYLRSPPPSPDAPGLERYSMKYALYESMRVSCSDQMVGWFRDEASSGLPLAASFTRCLPGHFEFMGLYSGPLLDIQFLCHPAVEVPFRLCSLSSPPPIFFFFFFGSPQGSMTRVKMEEEVLIREVSTHSLRDLFSLVPCFLPPLIFFFY